MGGRWADADHWTQRTAAYAIALVHFYKGEERRGVENTILVFYKRVSKYLDSIYQKIKKKVKTGKSFLGFRTPID